MFKKDVKNAICDLYYENSVLKGRLKRFKEKTEDNLDYLIKGEIENLEKFKRVARIDKELDGLKQILEALFDKLKLDVDVIDDKVIIYDKKRNSKKV